MQSYNKNYASGRPVSPPYPQEILQEIIKAFRLVDADDSGKITTEELKVALKNAQGKHFSEKCCKLMIGLFDRDKNGTIDVNEFQELYVYINQWLAIFYAYDKDRSGYIEEPELALALHQMGYRFTRQFTKLLVDVTDTVNRKGISIDQFIIICVQILRFTDAFRVRDKHMKGIITIDFEDFLKVFFELSL